MKAKISSEYWESVAKSEWFIRAHRGRSLGFVDEPDPCFDVLDDDVSNFEAESRALALAPRASFDYGEAMHRLFISPARVPQGGWFYPGAGHSPSFPALLQRVKFVQGANYVGDDQVAMSICMRDRSFCKALAFEEKPENQQGVAVRAGGCVPCGGGRVR